MADLLIIGEHNYQQFCPQGGMKIDGVFQSTGWVPRPQSETTIYAKSWPFQNIPRSEWPERIEEYRTLKRSPFYLADLHNSPCKDQNGTNYCWQNAPTRVMEYRRMQMGMPVIPLSPASVAAKIKNFRNEGGWGTLGLEYMIEHGIAPAEVWPVNAIQRQYDNSDSQASRLNFKPTEYFELPANDFEAKMTALLMGFVLACAYDWWGHEITAVAPWMSDDKRSFGSEEENSWGMNWPKPGAKGRTVLQESKSRSSDVLAISQVLPYTGPAKAV